ncbi:hypothetical protein SAY86_025211 [Trapa natans]|uniref:protein-serine/threonine phosphatase n=1 Tax=Trapa natans TaxID=22666 RepID=A0AAN7RIS3_TRANT|nr:hypothetical protein SAY86_025211 [Trapa natans]
MLEPMPFKLAVDAAAAVAVASPQTETCRKRRKIEVLRLACDGSIPKERNSTFESLEGTGLSVKESNETVKVAEDINVYVKESNESPVKGAEDISNNVSVTEGEVINWDQQQNQCQGSEEQMEQAPSQERPKFGLMSVCGRRRDMEDAVTVHPWFCSEGPENQSGVHLFGVFDGHGCSHVALRCKSRMHEIVNEEIGRSSEEQIQWKETMERSFTRMDREVNEYRGGDDTGASSCRCELQTPQCDAVGSTAVVAVVTPDKIVVSNCGDSRAVLCRVGVAIPLSSDHKPDRPDELSRIQEAGGRVIYWDGPRVLGVLAMSRAIGDNYLKPYVIPDPEVTVTERTEEDMCLILASDGLWDVVSNETACGVARTCLRSQKLPSPARSPGSADLGAVGEASEGSDKACSDASLLLTKLALARHSTDNVSVVVVDLRREKAEQQQQQPQ